MKRLQEQILAQDPALEAPPLIVEFRLVQLEGGPPLLAGREREPAAAQALGAGAGGRIAA